MNPRYYPLFYLDPMDLGSHESFNCVILWISDLIFGLCHTIPELLNPVKLFSRGTLWISDSFFLGGGGNSTRLPGICHCESAPLDDTRSRGGRRRRRQGRVCHLGGPVSSVVR